LRIVVVIPAQPATQNEVRQAVLFSCYRDGSLLLEGKDCKKPQRFFLSPKDTFPWDQFLQKMLVAWQLGDYQDIPHEFKPLKRIPQFVLDGFPNEPLENQLKILATLRSQGYFSSLPPRK
jgi:hypothetical protein